MWIVLFSEATSSEENNLVANRRFGAGPMKIPALPFISQTYRTLNVPLGRGLIGSEEFIQRDRDESTYT